MKAIPLNRKSAFAEFGLKATIAALCEEIRELYLADGVPWIVGYSGGKDSTATLQLVWLALKDLKSAERTKQVHVISTDTLVENPVISGWVSRSLSVMKTSAEAQQVPFVPHKLTPRVEDSFWVNLIGRGYPAPRHKFRWCTERLKIRPSNAFINKVVSENGEAILLLGARKAESSRRSFTLKNARKFRVQDRLSPNSTLPGCMVYTPIEDWSNDDVWLFLQQIKNPWGCDNNNLLGIYQGANPDGECPLVVDSSTPSCGDSRFGCWVCTLVEKDKSMSAMIQNDADKEWMMPLLELRNMLDFRLSSKGDGLDHHLRDFRRMSGQISIMEDGRVVPGPYTQESRQTWLRKLLEAETWIRKNGPDEVRTMELVTVDELQEIRKIWVIDKHEIEDSLPQIYQSITGRTFPGKNLDDSAVLGLDEVELLRELCEDKTLHFELTRELLSLSRQQRQGARRAGHYEKLEGAFKKGFFADATEATDVARRKHHEKLLAREGRTSPTHSGKEQSE
jgi:DNA sulfur modification protein DndC